MKTFEEFIAFCKDVIEFKSRSDGDYYGNCTNYQVKFCDLNKLYKYLVSKNLI